MKVVSLFSGAGGLDLGFKMAGHETFGQMIYMRMPLKHTSTI